MDACYGGFMLPWIERLGYPVPKWDFRIPEVSSCCKWLKWLLPLAVANGCVNWLRLMRLSTWSPFDPPLALHPPLHPPLLGC